MDIIKCERRLACKNSKFEVFFDHIEWTDGQRVEDYLVVAPYSKTGDLVAGVSVLPVIDSRFGLIRVYRHAIGDYAWEVPRGFIDEGETALISALRELREETGLICREEDMRSLGVITPEAGTLAARLHLFGAFNCVQTRPFEAAEFGHKDFCFFDATEISAMIKSSKIQDPSTLVAYFKLQAFPSLS